MKRMSRLRSTDVPQSVESDRTRTLSTASPPPLRVWPGLPYPLGATWDGKGVNVAVFSVNAEKIELCLFDASGEHETARVPLPNHTDEIWHGYFPDLRPGRLYRLRATDLMNRPPDIASMPINCCWTRSPSGWWDR